MTTAATSLRQQLPVDLDGAARGLGPAEVARPLETGGREPVVVGERALDPAGKRGRVSLLDEDRRVARHLRQRAGRRRDDRRAGGHRLEDGQAEALVARREDEAGGSAVEGRELVLRDVASELDSSSEPGRVGGALGRHAPALVRAGEHEAERVVAHERQGLDRALRILARLDRPDDERVRRAVLTRAVRRERGIDAVRGDDDLLVRDVVELDQVALRALGDGQHAIGVTGGAGNGRPEDQPVAQAHQARVALEREVVDCHDAATRAAERDRVLEVRDRGIQAPQEPGQGRRHAPDLAARLQLHRLDPVRDEVGPSRDRGEAEVGDARELAQEGGDVGLVAGSLPPEHVRVDHHERSAHAAASR